MSQKLRFSLLGTPKIWLDDVPISKSLTRKAQAMLYFLAVEGTPQSRDTLATLLWANVTDPRAKGSLRIVLVKTRKVLDDFLIITRQTIGLVPESYWLDNHRFCEVLAEPENIQQSFKPEVLELYRGDFLNGFHVPNAPVFDEWQRTQQEYLRAQALQKWDHLINDYQSAGNYTLAARINQKYLMIDPLNETAHQRQMRIYLTMGQKSSAVHQYRVCAEILQRELGVGPSNETQALLQEINHAPQTNAQIAAISPDTMVTRPKAPTQSIPQVHFSPPLLLNKILGREQQIERITRKLTDGQERLITLVGMSGSGKTVLAHSIAEQMAKLLRNGACFISLTSITAKADPKANELQIALLLKAGLRIEDSRNEALAALRTFLRDKDLLLVLDNCEHLVDAMGIISELLSAAPQIRILTTSHMPLRLSIETIEPVRGLLPPPSNASPEEIADNPAVQVFTNRTLQLLPEFNLTATKRADIATICQLVDGLPLALELAASWTPLYTPAEIAGLIQQQPHLLTSSYSDTPERHRSLSALLSSTWQMLTAEEQRVLSAMAVFAGGADRRAVDAVIHANPLTLNTLLQRSLLSMNQQGRFLFHPLMRSFCCDQLMNNQSLLAATQKRHSCFYAELLAAAFAAPGRIFPAWETVAAIELEYNNILFAWQWAFNHRHTDLLLGHLEKIYEFFNRRERLEEGEILFQEAVSRLQEFTALTPDEQRLLGHSYKYLGQFNNKRGNWQLSRENIERGLAIMQGIGESESSTFALGRAFLAYSLAQQGDLAGAHDEISISIAMLNTSSDTIYLVDALLVHSTIQQLQGKFAEADSICEHALLIAEQGDYSLGAAKALSNLGYIKALQGNLDQAMVAWEKCLPIFRAEMLFRPATQMMNNLGYIYVLQREFGKAKQLLEKALAAAQQLGIHGIEAEVLDSLGGMAYGMGDFPAARQYYTLALRLMYQIGDERKCADYLWSVAGVYLGEGQQAEAFLILYVLQNYFLFSSPRQQQIANSLHIVQDALSSDELDRLVTQSAHFNVLSLAEHIIEL